MDPEPVRPDPATIVISTPRGNPNTAGLTLLRNGPQPFDFEITVTYGSGASGWLAVDPAAGTAQAGAATVRLTPSVANLNLTIYSATLRVSINGSPGFDVPVSLTVRNPILRVVHTGNADGGASVEDNEFVRLGYFDTNEGTFSFEVEVPFGEDVYLHDLYEECEFDGFYLDGRKLPGHGRIGPLTILEDTTIEANYLLCTSCAVILVLFPLVGMRLTRPNL